MASAPHQNFFASRTLCSCQPPETGTPMPTKVPDRTRSKPASLLQRKSMLAVIVGGFVDASTLVDLTTARGL